MTMRALALNPWRFGGRLLMNAAGAQPGRLEAADTEAIEAVLNGDTARFADLVDKYQEQALAVAYGLLGNYEDAKDVAQEAFVSAYRSLGRYRGTSKFSTWLYRIVVNKCKDLYRQRSRRPVAWKNVGDPHDSQDENLFVAVADNSATAEMNLQSKEIAQQLSHALRALPMKQRTAFALHHLQGLPLAEVAAVMEVRIGTAKTHVFRATEFLRRRLDSLKEDSR